MRIAGVRGNTGSTRVRILCRGSDRVGCQRADDSRAIRIALSHIDVARSHRQQSVSDLEGVPDRRA